MHGRRPSRRRASAGRPRPQAARALAHAALAGPEAAHGTDHPHLAAAASAETGLALPGWARPVPHGLAAVGPGPALDVEGEPRIAAGPGSGSGVGAGHGPSSGNGAGADHDARHRSGTTVRIRLLGGCGIDVEDRRIILDGAKPRVRSLFRLLALHAGAPVHREVLQEALWPDADAAAGSRSLHVALTALRRHLDDTAAPLDGRLVAREGDAYRLDVGPDDVDLGRFDRAIAAGRAARARGEASAAAFTQAIDLYTGELLPEEGPAEWVAERRDHCRARAVEAAQGLAEEALLAGDHATVVRACRFGLELDRYQDAFWRMLILARERAGDAGAASRDRREYALVLEALGVATPGAIGPS